MIKIEKDITNIPKILDSQNREEAYKNNIKAKEYVDDNNRYKVGSVQKKLIEIYNCKCGYCEQSLLDSPKHIEHYRPKKHAYSWDNLLLACNSCNSTKNDNFEVQNQKVIYNNETFENRHNLRDTYDNIESPLIINPEKDDVIDLLIYNKNAIVSSNDKRVSFTIETGVGLNRDELVFKRLLIINDFINIINDCYLLFLEKRDINFILPVIKQFLKKNTKEMEFYSLRYFMVNNIDKFFDDKKISLLVNGVIQKLSRKEV